jgi:transposase
MPIMFSLSTVELTRIELEQTVEQQAQIIEQQAQSIEQQAQIIEQQAQSIEQQAQIIEEQAQTVVQMKEEIGDLREKQEENSSNSGKPPSTDSPKDREKRRRTQRKLKNNVKRKRGAQKGHDGHHRALVPPERVDHIVDCHPDACECGREPKTAVEVNVERHQVVEIPPITPDMTEFRVHSSKCPCGKVNQGRLPDGVTQSPFGPRLVALVCLLTCLYRMSKRQAAHLLSCILGVSISTGAIIRCENRMSAAIAQPVEAVKGYILEQYVKHADATSWRESWLRRQLWTIATVWASVFIITIDGTMQTVQRLLSKTVGILVSDRARVFSFWPLENRQVCWAHIIRLFVKFAERSGESHRIGEALLAHSAKLFDLWHRVRDGTLKRGSFRQYSYEIRKAVRRLLEEGKECKHKKTRGSCKDLLRTFDAMWTFIRVEGVEPTNNHAEREIRNLVIWRRTSFGTQSERGSRYIERMATVVSTLRKQERDVLEYLTAAYQASLLHQSPPSLLPG